MISALILEEILWKSRSKCGLLCKNKIVTIFLQVFYTSKRYLLKKHTSYIPIIYCKSNLNKQVEFELKMGIHFQKQLSQN